MGGFLGPGTFSTNAGEFQALGKSPILEDPPLYWVLGLLWVGSRKMLLPWSSQSMGKRYESGRTYIAAEPPRRTGGLREGFLLATRSGLPTVPRPLMCVCVCMCMFVCVCEEGISSASLYCRNEGFHSPALDREGEGSTSSSHRQGPGPQGVP